MGEPTPFTTSADDLLYRPIGLLLILIGFTLFVVNLPFSAIGGGDVSKTYENLVVAATKYTFTRPLGEIDP